MKTEMPSTTTTVDEAALELTESQLKQAADGINPQPLPHADLRRF